MSEDILTRLGITPRKAGFLEGRQRMDLMSFLLRWEYYHEALACLESLIPVNPKLVSLLDDRARAQMALGQHDAALETMRARQRVKDSLQAQVLLARIHLARGDKQGALQIAAQAVSQEPYSALALSLLGDAHLACGDAEHALSTYQRLQSVSQGHTAYLLGMMGYYEARGERVTASSYAVRVQQANDPDHPLPVYHVRHLRDYYRRSGEVNRALDLEAHLAQRHEREVAELQAALQGQPAPRQSLAREQAPEPRKPVAPPPESVVAPVTSLASLLASAEERDLLERAARERFGHAGLLPGQAETMAAIMRGQDVLTILPTGGGKSLCYQLPASMDRKGLTLVVSPLIALMKDQLESLPPDVRCRTAVINSTLDGDELQNRIAQIGHGNYCLVYAAPERLRQTPFVRALRLAGVNRLVVDEAHCVSLWGHDFRPDYLYLGRVRQALGRPPVLAMTATAPPRVRSDILQRLGGATSGTLGEMSTVAGNPFRPNLFFEVVRLRNADEKMARLLALCQAAEGSGIVYVNSRERSEKLAQLLCSRGIAAGYYHAGIGDRGARDAAQDQFMSGHVRVMVATIAFGMGIDKADIRWILHYDLPSSLETYYQEAGRAGRDGRPAHCILFYAPADRGLLTLFAHRDALSVETLRAVYATVRQQLGGASLGRVVLGDLMREVQADETPVRVALGMLEEAGLLRRHQDIPRTALVRRPLNTWRRDRLDEVGELALAAFTIAARLETGESLRLDLLDVARKAGQDPLQIEEHVLHWADAGIVEYRPAGRDALIEIMPSPPDASNRVEALLDRYATVQTQRIDEVVAYAKTTRCRHGHISAYLSGQEMVCRTSCDICAPDGALTALAGDVDLPDEEEQIRIVLRCVADVPWNWQSGSLVAVLRGGDDAPEPGRQCKAFGALSFRSEGAVEKMVDSLVRGRMFYRRRLDDGNMVLDLTSAGRKTLEAVARPTTLPHADARQTVRPVTNARPPVEVDTVTRPLDDGRPFPMRREERRADPSREANGSASPTQPGSCQPSEAAEPLSAKDDVDDDVDRALLERLRRWCKEMARAEGVPIFMVFQDVVLQRIAMFRPRNEMQLLAIKGIRDRKIAKYGAAILAIVRERDQNTKAANQP